MGLTPITPLTVSRNVKYPFFYDSPKEAVANIISRLYAIIFPIITNLVASSTSEDREVKSSQCPSMVGCEGGRYLVSRTLT